MNRYSRFFHNTRQQVIGFGPGCLHLRRKVSTETLFQRPEQSGPDGVIVFMRSHRSPRDVFPRPERPGQAFPTGSACSLQGQSCA